MSRFPMALFDKIIPPQDACQNATEYQHGGEYQPQTDPLRKDYHAPERGNDRDR
jgi:hypothetical protein